MGQRQMVIAGGGAAGFFAAIALAERAREAQVTILEKGPDFLSKVRISGGGRCNVTHACFDPRELCGFYPRGGKALLGAFNRFQPRDTIEWFQSRGVRLKTEPDGRMFPVTDSSGTIVDCLAQAARGAGVQLVRNCAMLAARRLGERGFELKLSNREPMRCDALLLATGGCRSASAGEAAVSLGHTLEPPVPSLFTFNVAAPWLNKLSGITVEAAAASVPGQRLEASGPMLVTHTGLSGPAILKLSAWGARILHSMGYKFPLQIQWLPGVSDEEIARRLQRNRAAHPAKLIVNTPPAHIPSRLWEALVTNLGISRETRWAALAKAAQHQLVQQITRTQLQVSGKSINREEFVTCGGVPAGEVNFKTMESKRCQGLHFAGELLDIDALTGGFNFQAAWTTGWIAGNAMADTIAGQ